MKCFPIAPWALLFGLLSCLPAAQPEGAPIRIDVSPTLGVESKASAVTTLSSFYVTATSGSTGSEQAVWSNATFSGSSGSGYTSDKVWPRTNPSYHFYAANVPVTATAGGGTLSASNGTDVVCACAPNPVFQETVTLSFQHIFARLGNVTVRAGGGYTLSSISIRITPLTGGTYNMRSGAWSGISLGSATAIANAQAGTRANDLWLVPGTYTLSLSWTASKGGSSHGFSGITTQVTLQAGKRNHLDITLFGGEPVELSCSLDDWDTQTLDAFGLINDCLTIEAITDGSLVLGIDDDGYQEEEGESLAAAGLQSLIDRKFYWRFAGDNDWRACHTSEGFSFTMTAGCKLFLVSFDSHHGFGYSYGSYLFTNRFSGTCDFYAYGDMGSLLKNSGGNPRNWTCTDANGATFPRLFKDSNLHSHRDKKLYFGASRYGPQACYEMFAECQSLSDSPVVFAPDATLSFESFAWMFRDSSLEQPPQLPFTSMAEACYAGLFSDCAHLEKAPELPATTLAKDCYAFMFESCTGLQDVPARLPATSLATACYSNMFNGCTALRSAPELPATALVQQCYENLFYNCSNLRRIKALFTTSPSASYTQNWVRGVASGGDFIRNSTASWSLSGANGIHSGWTLNDISQ